MKLLTLLGEKRILSLSSSATSSQLPVLLPIPLIFIQLVRLDPSVERPSPLAICFLSKTPPCSLLFDSYLERQPYNLPSL